MPYKGIIAGNDYDNYEIFTVWVYIELVVTVLMHIVGRLLS